MASAEEFSELTLEVKSRILQRIQRALAQEGGAELAATMYTKSDGKNYGMHQKSDELAMYEDIWEAVFKPGVKLSGIEHFQRPRSE